MSVDTSSSFYGEPSMRNFNSAHGLWKRNRALGNETLRQIALALNDEMRLGTVLLEWHRISIASHCVNNVNGSEFVRDSQRWSRILPPMFRSIRTWGFLVRFICFSFRFIACILWVCWENGVSGMFLLLFFICLFRNRISFGFDPLQIFFFAVLYDFLLRSLQIPAFGSLEIIDDSFVGYRRCCRPLAHSSKVTHAHIHTKKWLNHECFNNNSQFWKERKRTNPKLFSVQSVRGDNTERLSQSA